MDPKVKELCKNILRDDMDMLTLAEKLMDMLRNAETIGMDEEFAEAYELLRQVMDILMRSQDSVMHVTNELMHL